ncbi:MAG: hypothetical protein IPK92_17225 [Nitrospira sp.]|jgi:hypothetical protein|nr:hypothetical protein [Nitrospira sp.]
MSQSGDWLYGLAIPFVGQLERVQAVLTDEAIPASNDIYYAKGMTARSSENVLFRPFSTVRYSSFQGHDMQANR